jgi:hypothetical protein
MFMQAHSGAESGILKNVQVEKPTTPGALKGGGEVPIFFGNEVPMVPRMM